MLDVLKSRNLVLGSGSPRRRELLSSLGLLFEVKVVDTDESAPSGYGPAETAIHISREKAIAIYPKLKQNEIVLTADTEVWLNKHRFGKPDGVESAIEMLNSLSGKVHEVITGFCLLGDDRIYSEAVSTKVEFKDLSEEEISFYVENYKPFDKAGAYGIQEWIGMIGIKSITGSYFNVVGLPVMEVFSALKSWK